MMTIARLLCLLMLFPLFFLSSEARASDIVVTGGSTSFGSPRNGIGGRFSIVNNSQGFAANGATEDEVYYEQLDGYRAGDTFTASLRVGYFTAGSATINGQTYSPIYFRNGDGGNSSFFFTATPLVLPPRDPSQSPGQSISVSFTTPFTFNGTLNGYPCYNARQAGRPDSSLSTTTASSNQNFSPCTDPLFIAQLSGKGTATVYFGSYFDSQVNDYVYDSSSVVYNFESVSCFSVGKGDQKFGLCISEDGNLREFESPQAVKHLTNKEGYALCSAGNATAYDDGVTNSGWGASTISQPGGANTLPLIVTRTTSDGRFEMNQIFEWDNKEREVNITMTLKNLSGGTATGVQLSRYFDGNISNSPNNDRYAAISDSVWAWDDGTGAGGGQRGLMLTSLSSGYPHAPAVEKMGDWVLGSGGAQTARTCAPANVATPTAPGDYVGRLTYKLGTIRAGASKTVKVQYKRM